MLKTPNLKIRQYLILRQNVLLANISAFTVIVVVGRITFANHHDIHMYVQTKNSSTCV